MLDVRRADEHDAARIDGAVNIPLHELPGASADVPAGEVWVHCAGGYRASVAASMLDAAGRSLVAVDDSFDNAEKVGLHLVGPDGVTLVLAVVAGALIGLSLGALGGGGSILAVPVLVYALGQSPAQATTGSLVVVGVTSLVGAVTAHRAGNVLLARGVTFGVVAIGGAVAGARASAHVPEPVLLGRLRRSDAGRRPADGRPPVARPTRRPRAGAAVRPARRPDHHLQPHVRLPVPTRAQGARHRDRGRPAHRVPRRGRRVPRRPRPPARARPARWSTPPAPRSS